MTASRKRRWPRSVRGASRWLAPLTRISVITLLVLLGLFAAFRIASPFLISTGLVRGGIEDALSNWTGYTAEIEGTPVLEFWPTPRITLNQVTIRRRLPGPDKVLGHVDSLAADFSLLAALRGQVVFHEFHFTRPSLHLVRDENGLIDWTNEGLLARAIAGARAGSGGGETLDAGLDAEIGSLTVEDGTLDVTDQVTGKVYRFDSVAADINWPRLSGTLGAVIIARVNGLDLKLDFSSMQPLLLFAGKNADVRTSLSSNLVTTHFDGVANVSSVSSLAGHVELSVPDVPALLSWSGKQLPVAQSIRNVSLSADVSSIEMGQRFSNLTFAVNDATATGIMDFTYTSAGKPKIGATLAFNQMNLSPFLAAFSLRLAADGEQPGLLNGDLLKSLELDLRLSARRAVLEPFSLDDVGASVLVTAGKATFDIGDSQFENGELTARLEVTERDFDGGGKLQLSVHDADFTALIDRLGLAGPLPRANGSLDLSLSTSKPIWNAGMSDVSGRVRFSSGPGFIRQLDIGMFRTLAAEKAFFSLSDAASASFDFNSMSIDASFANGSAEVRKLAVNGPVQSLTLSGVVPYRTNGLALSGSLEATDVSRADDLPMLPFFVGGSWPDPVISSLSVMMQRPAQ
ncbi:AsmA-like C-terminal region-containing protein [Rhizobium sp. BK251]|uniref:AsmA family protein n=1 Tax=Rhizobium sp. BK251 TaxID=2512125 RepID=UPI001051AE30|nr:AsmA-like C-terminal region-containing protein [Rhizobium sp. BK251]TCL75678.1 AsmA protein [Rhizobium sp. BK251]